MEVKMKIEKRVLSGALRVLGKVVCQRSPVEEYRSIRFWGGEDSVSVSATNGREWITLDLPCQADGVRLAPKTGQLDLV